jgi:hypothetical protein
MLRTVSQIRPRLSSASALRPAKIQLSATVAKHPRTATALAVGLVAAALHAHSPLQQWTQLQRRSMSTSPVLSSLAGGRTDQAGLASTAGASSSAGRDSAADWASAQTAGSSLPYAVYTKPLEVSPLDDRSYRLVRLPNGLEALLVQDEQTDKAAAAVDVKVGHLSDPRELAGCAHLVEHMKFLGTKKVRAPELLLVARRAMADVLACALRSLPIMHLQYPRENDYSEVRVALNSDGLTDPRLRRHADPDLLATPSQFLSANGGSSNAFTGECSVFASSPVRFRLLTLWCRSIT